MVNEFEDDEIPFDDTPKKEDVLKANPEIEALMKRFPGMEITIPKSALPKQAKPAANEFEDTNEFEQDHPVSGAGSTLAKHRWKRLVDQPQGAFPVAGMGSQTYDQLIAQPSATPLTNFENQPRSQGLLSGDQTPPTQPSATPLTDFENRGAYGTNQGLLTGVNVPPMKGVETPFTKQEAPDASTGLRAAANLPASAIGLGMAVPQMAMGFGKDLASTVTPGQSHLTATAKDLATYVVTTLKEGGRSALWLLAQSVNPQVGEELKSHGVSPDAFVDMWANDPLGVSLIVLGGIEGGVKGVKLAGAATDIARNGLPGIEAPTPGDFNMGNVPPSEVNPAYWESQVAKSKLRQSARDMRAAAAVRGTRADVENDWRDRVAILNEQQRGAREATSVSEQARQQTLIDTSGGKITTETGKPRYLASGTDIPEATAQVRQALAYEHTEFQNALNQGAAEMEPPNRPSKAMQQWSMEEGFKKKLFPPKETGATLSPEEAAFRTKQQLEQTTQGNAGWESMVERSKSAKEKRFEKKAKKGKGGVTLGTGPGALQDFLEKRLDPDERNRITSAIDDFRKAGITHAVALEKIDDARRAGEISPIRAHALEREAHKQYQDVIEREHPLAEGQGPVGETPTTEAPSAAELELDRRMSEQHQARPPLPREPEGFSKGPLPNEPGGTNLGMGLGGAQKAIEKTWSNTAALVEKLPDVIKADSLFNWLSKDSQRHGIPFTKAESDILEIPKFMEANRGKIVSKEDLREWIADRLVRTEEKELVSARMATLDNMTGDQLEAIGRGQGEGLAKFERDDLVLPGGKNYREVVIKSPEAFDAKGEATPTSFRGGHYEPNTIAHMRLTDRPVTIGGKSHDALFSEEFQSDWEKANRSKIAKDYYGGVTHPLLAEWKETLFKRLLRKAAEEGKDAIAWTTGKQQADRYNLRKHVERVHLEPTPRGGGTNWQPSQATTEVPQYTFTGITKDGQVLVSKRVQTFDQLSTLVGPDVAKKLMTGEAKEKLDMGLANEVKGQDLEIGGKWTTDLYDRQMVDIANKWAKRFGGKVEAGGVDLGKSAKKGGLDYEGRYPSQSELRALAKDRNLRPEVRDAFKDVSKMVDAGTSVSDAIQNQIDMGFFGFDEARVLQGTLKRRSSVPQLESVHALPLTDAMKQSLLIEGSPTFGFLTKEGHAEAITNLRNVWSRLGRTLGSGPGEAFTDIVGNLTKIGLYHISHGVTDFSAYTELMRRDAAQTGFPVTDEMLTAAWNHPDSQKARVKLPPNLAIAQATDSGVTKTDATNFGGQGNSTTGQFLLAPELGSGPTSMQSMTATNHAINALRDLWNSDFGTRSGVNEKARRYFPRVNEQATYHITSQALSFLKSRTHVAELKAIFGRTPEGFSTGGSKATIQHYLHDFSDLILDDRSRALDARSTDELATLKQQLNDKWTEAMSDGRTADADTIASTIEDLGEANNQVPKLDPTKRAKLLADPKIQAAIEYWHKSVKPQIDHMTEDLDIQARLDGPLGLYVKFRQLDVNQAARRQRTRPVGEYQPPPGEHAPVSRVGVTTSESPWNVRPGFSGSAKRATGKLLEGRGYENDVRYMLENTYSDRILAQTKNDLRQAVREAAKFKKSEWGTKPVPPTVMVGGKPEPLVGLTLEGPSGRIEDTYYVPLTVSETYKSAMQTMENSNFRQVWDLASSAATAQVIVLPAEAVRHGFNALSAVVNSRFMYKHGAPAEIGETLLSATTLGLSKMATVLSRAYHLEGPALADAVERYGRAGGLRLNGYEGTNVQRSLLIRAAEKIPGIRPLKDLVFGDPGSTKGFSGMETRLRIVVGEAIREMEPGLSDAELAAKVNDGYGTYVSKLQPALTKALGPFDPFARAGVGLTRSGIRLLEGRAVAGGVDINIPGTDRTLMKGYSPLIHAQVAGTLAAIMLYNRLLDDEDKWPWERPEYRFGDLVCARRGGKTYRVSFSDLANGLKRGAEFTGLTGIANALIRGERAPSVLTSECIRGIRNAYANRASPLIKALYSLTSGYSLAQSPSGDFYRTVKPSMTSAKGSAIPQRVKDVAVSSAPGVSKAFEALKQTLNPSGKGPDFLHPSEDKLLPDSYLGKVAYDIQDIFSVPYVPIIEPKSKAEKAGGEVQRRVQQEFTDTTRSIAREALNLPTERRIKYVKDQIDQRIGNELITVIGNPAPAKPEAFKQILAIMFKAQSYNTKAETLQKVNAQPTPAQ